MNTTMSVKNLIKTIDSESLDHPREIGRRMIEATVPSALWKKNVELSHELQRSIDKHKLCRHPLIGLLNTEKLNVEATKAIHLEFSYAFAEVFTDSLIQAMATSSSLEKRLGAGGKVAARFLLQLNLLDELGYKPKKNEADHENYCGNPLLAHYVQFNETLEELGAEHSDIMNFKPSAAAKAARSTFTDYYNDHLNLTAVLAVAETVFRLFAGPWAQSVKLSTNIDVSKGYHKIHVEDDSGEFLDDDHSEDSWYIFRQVVQEKDYDVVRENISQWLEIWYDLGDQVMHMARQLSKK